MVSMRPVSRIYDTILEEHLAQHRQMALVSGPRQVGKTTTCRHHADSYVTWDNTDARVRAKKRARQIMATLVLSELRQTAGITQKEAAKRLGVAQPTLSRLEKQDDMQVTTLSRLVTALGGRLSITADFPDRSVVIGQFSGKGKSLQAKPHRYRPCA